MRRLLFAVVAVASMGASARAVDPVAVLVIEGRGFGHGVGMAQDGAFWMGRSGATTEQILGQFYPGTGLGRAGGQVRVPVFDAGTAPTNAVIAFPNGGEVRESESDGVGGGPRSGFPLRVGRGGRVRVGWDGNEYWAEPVGGGESSLGRVQLASSQVDLSTTSTSRPLPTSTTSTSSTSTSTTVPAGSTSTTSPSTTIPRGERASSSARPLVAVASGGGTVEVPARQRSYRGVVEVTAAAGPLRLVNRLDVETYLKGMGEVRDPSWPPAALRAQAIAARTYGLRAMGAAGEICETQRCQVYLGAQAEYAAMNKAVEATAGRVVTHRGVLASAVYSSNGGGHSASREEGFGLADEGHPYLRPSPYQTRDPAPWTVRVSLADVARRFAYAGTLTGVAITRTGPSGRALDITLDGSAGQKVVPGLAFDAGLALRSTLFSLRIEQGEAPPPPPQEESPLQLLPEQAAIAAPGVAPDAAIPAFPAAPSGAEPRRQTGRYAIVAALLALFAAGWAATTFRNAKT